MKLAIVMNYKTVIGKLDQINESSYVFATYSKLTI